MLWIGWPELSRLRSMIWERVSLVASAAELDDPRAVSIILKQLRSTVYRGGRELEKSLGEIVARLRTAVPSELLREVAQVLPIESSYLAGGEPGHRSGA
jgi:hypothetical protein